MPETGAQKEVKTQYEIIIEDPEARKQLAVERLVLDVSFLIAGLMQDQKISKADLARRLSKSRAWVTQLLNGSANMTIRTLAEVVHALDAEVNMESRPFRFNSSREPNPPPG